VHTKNDKKNQPLLLAMMTKSTVA